MHNIQCFKNKLNELLSINVELNSILNMISKDFYFSFINLPNKKVYSEINLVILDKFENRLSFQDIDIVDFSNTNIHFNKSLILPDKQTKTSPPVALSDTLLGILKKYSKKYPNCILRLDYSEYRKKDVQDTSLYILYFLTANFILNDLEEIELSQFISKTQTQNIQNNGYEIITKVILSPSDFRSERSYCTGGDLSSYFDENFQEVNSLD